LKCKVAAKPGALTGLVQLLGSSNEHYQREGVRALQALAAGSEDVKRQVAATPGALTGLVRLLGSDDVWLQQAVVLAVSHLSYGSASVKQSIAAEPDALKLLRQVWLSNSSSNNNSYSSDIRKETRCEAARALSNLAAGSNAGA
jgi:hypothetical protein